MATLENEDYSYLPKGELKANLVSCSEWQEFDKIILKYMTEQRIPGLSLAVNKKESYYVQCYGWSREEVPLHDNHLFRIASVSKILTAVGIMKLLEAKQLKLGDRVFGSRGILKQFSPVVGGDQRLLKVTVRHLLQHSGGWDRDEVGDPCFWKGVDVEMGIQGPVNQHQLITYMMGQKLQFVPGARYAYSNFGYIVLGRIIEELSGKSYEDYIKGVLAEIDICRMQLGRSKKCQAHPDEVEYFPTPKQRSVDSVFAGEGKVTAPYGGFAMESGDSDGGWIAAPKDLVKILNALDSKHNPIISKKSLKQMLGRPSYGKGPSWYGLGLDVSWNKKAWEHSGHMEGATSALVRTRSGYTFAVLCNYWPQNSDYSSLVEYALSCCFNPKTKLMVYPMVDAATMDKNCLLKLSTPTQEFTSIRATLESQLYQAKWITAYSFKGNIYVNSIWKKSMPTKFRFLLSNVNLTLLVEELKTTTSVSIQIDSVTISQDVYYSLIFESGSRDILDWALVLDLPTTSVDTVICNKKDQGYVPICISTCCIKETLSTAILFHKMLNPQPFWYKTGLTGEKYQRAFDQHSRWGHLLTYIDTFTVDKKTNFNAIWSDSGPYIYSCEQNMSRYRLLNDFHVHAALKFEPSMVCGYEGEEDGGHQYLAVYTKYVQPGEPKAKKLKSC